MVVAVVPVCPPRGFPAEGRRLRAGLLEQASAWYEAVSRGRCRLDFLRLAPVAAPQPLAVYAVARGRGRWPWNSQALAADIVRALPPEGREALACACGRVLLVTGGEFLPHTWHVPDGGMPIGRGMWVRRYAAVPADAALGVVLHELGHLAFDWPDLQWPRDAETECLMARGATGSRAADPAPPCAPLLVRAGWRDPVPVTREMTVADLQGGVIGAIDWSGLRVLVEAGEDRLLMSTREPVPRMLARVSLMPADAGRPLLSLVAPRLRRLQTGAARPAPVTFRSGSPT